VSPGRTAAAAVGATLLAGLLALVVAGFSDQRATAFSAEVPAARSVITLGGHGSVCQQPIKATSAFNRLVIWTDPAVGDDHLVEVSAHPDTGPAQLAPVTELTGDAEGPFTAAQARLPRPIAPGIISVCLRSRGGLPIALGGAGSSLLSGSLTPPAPGGSALAMVFDTPHPHSLLALLPLMFSRAALFHPSWAGAWLFWALLALLCLGSLAVVMAASRAAIEELNDSESG
jgi:hypothetical protein